MDKKENRPTDLKIKIGKVANVCTTVIFVIWALALFLLAPLGNIVLSLIVLAVLFVLAAITIVIGEYCLKDYKEEKK